MSKRSIGDMQSGYYTMSKRTIGIQKPEVHALAVQECTLSGEFKKLKKQADRVFITLRARGVNEFAALLTPEEGGAVEAWVSMEWQKESGFVYFTK